MEECPAPGQPIENPTEGAALLHCGMIALVGRANVGKSSLLNAVLGEKVSIVSPVVQTTRNLIRGILNEERGQLVFLDTPGVHKASSELGKIMNRVARASIEGTDVVLLVTDASQPPRDEDIGWIRRLVKTPSPCVVALNKADISSRHAEDLRKAWAQASLEACAALPEAPPGPEPLWVEVSALTGRGLPELLAVLFNLVPPGPQLFPSDVLTDFPRLINIADIVREKLFLCLREELPHEVAVWIESVEEEPSAWVVNGTIYVNQPSQKPIVLGPKGHRLRAVRRLAEKELAMMYEKSVKLNLWIKVEKNWNRNYFLLKKIGYV